MENTTPPLEKRRSEDENDQAQAIHSDYPDQAQPIDEARDQVSDTSNPKQEIRLEDADSSLYHVLTPEEYEMEGTTLVKVTSKESFVAIPEEVKQIGKEAFSGCTALEEIIVPEGVDEIGADVFSGCTSLKKVSLPSTLEKIGYNAFSDCTSP